MNNRGYALLDVIVALMLASLMLYAGLRFFYVGGAHVAGAKSRTVSANLAAEQIELIRSAAYDSIGSTGSTNPWYSGEIPAVGIIPAEQTLRRANADYRVKVYVTHVDSPEDKIGSSDVDGSQDMKRVFVVVEGTDYPVRLSTLVVRP